MSLAASRLANIWRHVVALTGLIIRKTRSSNTRTDPSITAEDGLPSGSDDAEPNASIRLVCDATDPDQAVGVMVGGTWRMVPLTALAAATLAAAASALTAGATLIGTSIANTPFTQQAWNEYVYSVISQFGIESPTTGITDPGNGGAIPVTSSGEVECTTGASGQTRTLAAPTFAGQTLGISLNTHGGGNMVITVATLVNQTGNNTLTFAAAGAHIWLKAKRKSGAYRWTVVSNDGVTLSTV